MASCFSPRLCPSPLSDFPSSRSFLSRSLRRRAALLVLGVALLASLTACRSARQQGPRYFVAEPGVDYSRGMMHLVEKGDTLADIAAYYQRDVTILAYLNNITPPYTIMPGEYIYVPPDNSDAIVRSGKLSLARIQEVRGQMMAPEPEKSDIAIVRPRTQRPTRSSADSWMGPAERVDDTAGPAPDARLAFVWPLKGSWSRGFDKAGWRKYHLGVDIAAPAGTPIQAARDGVVLFSGRTSAIPAFGNMVAVDHGNGFTTIYAHCSQTLAQTGQKVDKNQIIARVGATGNATGNHVHLELRYNGRAVNPERYFPAFPKSTLVASQSSPPAIGGRD